MSQKKTKKNWPTDASNQMIKLSNNIINYNTTGGHEEPHFHAPPHDLLQISLEDPSQSWK